MPRAPQITDRKKDLIITGGGEHRAPEHRTSWVQPYVADAVVMGDRRNSPLVIVDEENCVRYAQDH
jgi:long-subunit acyl-CoA synthetase (AMP-forming)